MTTIEIEGDKVRRVFATLNPDKLARVKAPQGASSVEAPYGCDGPAGATFTAAPAADPRC